jgi:hypothetical protein
MMGDRLLKSPKRDTIITSRNSIITTILRRSLMWQRNQAT